MLTLKTLISSFQRLSVQIYKPKINQRTWMKPESVFPSNSAYFNIPKFSHTLLQNPDEKYQILNSVNSPELFPQAKIYFSSLNLYKEKKEKPIDFLKLHKRGPVDKRKSTKNPLGDKPFARGVILKTFVKKPKKPNSANRKCVLLRLSTGKEMTAYVPGEGHTLQEHNVVLVRVARLRDVPGVKLKCVRGAYDLGHVIKRK